MHEEPLEHAVAIIGLSGRFPKAESLEDFWQGLIQKRESISFFSDKELSKAGVSKTDLKSPNYVKARGILPDIENFDADFFGFTSREAEITDPQHRIFLECSWEALEDGGYDPDQYAGRMGVFGGCNVSSYFLRNLQTNDKVREREGDFTLQVANDKDFLTTRVSYKFNLKGPSLNIQTACSTSLVAIATACNQLLSYECDMALAGGINITVPTVSGYRYQEGMILSKDGHCKPFSSESKGTVMSDGAGVVLLKRLEDAIKDKDSIYAVIRGYGINNDGFEKMSFSAPSAKGQTEAIVSALSMAGVESESIGYVEAHGTGTILGDPIEIEGLKNAYQTDKKQYCAIGSVKENLGHTIAAAGVIGLIKAVLVLQNKKLPPSMHFKSANPHIDFENSPFYINQEVKEWTSKDYPRRAGVSSFGIGGTNAHVILEEWNQKFDTQKDQTSYPIILSAKTPHALKQICERLKKHLEKNPNLSLADVAYTLAKGRKLLEYATSFECKNLKEAIDKLGAFDESKALDKMDIDHLNYFGENEYNRVHLPTYPFQKKRYWVDSIRKEKNNHPQKEENPTSIEEVVQKTWEEFFGEKEIDKQADFFDLGGDSLLAIEIASSLSKKLGVQIGMQHMQTYPTIQKLSDYILENKINNELLIELKKVSGDQAIFFIHPIEGNLFCFNSLVSKWDLPISIYGLQAEDKTYASIEEMAKKYLKKIKKQKPKGPYSFVGASFGGILAYEMAKQLKNAGEKVEFLALLDAGRPDLLLNDSMSAKECMQKFLSLLGASSNQTINSEALAECLGIKSLSSQEKEKVYHTVEKHLKLLSHYKPQSYSEKLYFYESMQQGSASTADSWSDLAHQLEKHTTKGEHLCMLKKNQNDSLLQTIKKHFRK